MDLSMVHPAERHRKFVTNLAAQRPGLREPKMMGIAGLASTDKAGLRSDELEMRLVAVTSRFADRQHAFVDAASGGVAGALDRTSIL
jgi:hypothetical protein